MFWTLSEACSRLCQCQFLQVNIRLKALDEIFSFEQFHISVISQTVCTILQNSTQLLLIFKGDGRFCNVSSNFADFFGIKFSQKFSDFDRSDAKIAIFQRNVIKTNLLKFQLISLQIL